MKPLTIQRLQQLLAAYGADLDRFAAQEREAARALLEASAQARALWQAEAEQELDFAALRSLEAPLGAALERRLAELPVRVSQPRRWSFARAWAPVLAWAGAVAAGVWLGSLFPEDGSGGAAASASAVASEEGAAPMAGQVRLRAAGQVQLGMIEESEALAIAAGHGATPWEAP